MAGIVERPLAYADRLEARALHGIRRVVIHATELPDMATARAYGERIHHAGSRTGNSGHYYIDRDGSVERWVPVERVAHHVAGHNADSIGIELVNRGRWPDWYRSDRQHWREDYTDAQIDALIELLVALETQVPALAVIAGHDELDRRRVPASDDPDVRVPRKVDPGPRFPWRRVLDSISLQRPAGGAAP